MSWIKAPIGNLAELDNSIKETVLSHIKKGDFAEKDIQYVDSYRLKLLDKTLNLPDRQLELLRLVASRFDVKQRSNTFTSHRPIVGPIIVTFKKMLAPFVNALLGETLRQQRDFNAAVVDLLVEMGKDK